MKILIFGAGFLGRRLAEAWPDAVLIPARIDDPAAVRAALDAERPDAVFNAAGKTGHAKVDWCEEHRIETWRSNVLGPLNLAEACAERGIYLLHPGSGAVFNGPAPDPMGWREEDPANPRSFYARSKYAADLLLSRLPNVAVARFHLPIDFRPGAHNFIDKLASYAQVTDAANSVTVVDDLISALRILLERRGVGIFHVVNPGPVKNREILDLYRQYVDPSHACEWVSEDDLVARGMIREQRSASILQPRRLVEMGIQLRPAQVALLDTMKKYAMHKRQSQGFAPMSTPSPEFLRYFSPPAAEPMNPNPEFPQNTKRMKGVILAGGKGTRLAPLTNITNKHLLPIYDKPMVMYPLQTLIQAGIRDIMLVTGPEYAYQFIKLFGSGAALGVRLTYRIQDEAGGIAQALGLAEDFVGQDNCTVILGDNVFDEPVGPHIATFRSGAMAFYKPVANPSEYGVMEIDAQGRVISIEEKPKQPKSNLAQVGLYVYDSSVFEVVKTLKPSGRGELEITDVNNYYVRANQMRAFPLDGIWWDMGTFAGMQAASRHFAQKNGGIV